mmetsp:Transcript_14416/g.51882  ORF Transcript_14416/g.51882 Transcript_14416/m.51882 type:complete len:200 (+) Transcript_14416:1387-1986(+)
MRTLLYPIANGTSGGAVDAPPPFRFRFRFRSVHRNSPATTPGQSGLNASSTTTTPRSCSVLDAVSTSAAVWDSVWHPSMLKIRNVCPSAARVSVSGGVVAESASTTRSHAGSVPSDPSDPSSSSSSSSSSRHARIARATLRSNAALSPAPLSSTLCSCASKQSTATQRSSSRRISASCAKDFPWYTPISASDPLTPLRT